MTHQSPMIYILAGLLTIDRWKIEQICSVGKARTSLLVLQSFSLENTSRLERKEANYEEVEIIGQRNSAERF